MSLDTRSKPAFGQPDELIANFCEAARSRKAALFFIIFLTCLAYWPALDGKFIWDDETYIIKSPHILASDGLYRIWFTTEPEEYYPISNSSFWFEWRLFGLNPTGYHCVSLALHCASLVLLFLVLQNLSVPGALFAVFLFAIHPVNVESVAWIFQQRGLLALCFSLCSILAFLRISSRSFGWYYLSVALFAVAMLSKGSAAILPIVLLGILWRKQGIVSVVDLMRTAPFFLIAAVFTVVNIWFQAHSAEGAIRHATIAQRVAGAGVVGWFYLAKAILPINLSFVYPQIRVATSEISYWIPLAAIVIVSFALLRNRASSWSRRVLGAWAYFGVALLPVAGLVDAYFMKFSLVADHYEQLALIGVVALAGCVWQIAQARTEDPLAGRRRCRGRRRRLEPIDVRPMQAVCRRLHAVSSDTAKKSHMLVGLQ